MYKIKDKYGNETVNTNINGVSVDYKFNTEYELTEPTISILKDAGYELEEIKKVEVV